MCDVVVCLVVGMFVVDVLRACVCCCWFKAMVFGVCVCKHVFCVCIHVFFSCVRGVCVVVELRLFGMCLFLC